VTATFWTVAALFCGVAILILLVPLWRHRRGGGKWSPSAVVASVLIAPLALGLYFYVSNWDAEYAARVTQEGALLEQLAQHLDRNPDDARGWQLLAASYMQLGRYLEGRAAYERVWALTKQPDNELKVAYAEAQILADRSAASGAAGSLIEEVLAADPGNPKALWYGGLVALELGRDDIVRTRWTRLLALNPPDDVARVIQTQLAELGASPSGDASSLPPAPVGTEIKLSVTLGAAFALSDLPPGAQLFIIARGPEGGPPIAVIRQPPSTLPGDFSLSDANVMIQGRSLSAYPEITVVARLSRSGQPTAQPGDWQAEAVVRPGGSEPVALVIDQVVQ
jgi:cytochrome c-type biogenesis protein CcmH